MMALDSNNPSKGLKSSDDVTDETSSLVPVTSSSKSMSQSGSIKIFVRVRPPRLNSKLKATPGRYWCVNPNTSASDAASADDPDAQPKIGFNMPKDEAQGLINNQKESYDYRFHRVFDADTKQEEVFDYVAKDVILRFVVQV